MSNSSLVNYTALSPNYDPRNGTKIDKITIHHMAGNLSVETCGRIFADGSREASSNYGIGTDGRVGMYVEEKNRSWCSSNRANDMRAVTIEVANDQIGGEWHVSDTALNKLIDLCVDICKRNGIAKLNYTGDTSGNLTMHCWFVATACPGPYLKSKFPYIAEQVNKKLQPAPTPTPTPGTVYRVQVGAFSSKVNANEMLRKLKAAGFTGFITFTNNLYKVQVGAFQQKANAEKMVAELAKKGFQAFIPASNDKPTPPPAPKPTPAKKTVDQLAKEVLDGKWGNGDARKKNLIAAGYDYNAVQKRVNELLGGGGKSIQDIAKEVIAGKWGNGLDRKQRLEAAGYNYSAVQAAVDAMLG